MRSVYILRKFSPRNVPFLPIRESSLPRKFPAIQYLITLSEQEYKSIAMVYNNTTVILHMSLEEDHSLVDQHM